jgi:glutamate synthase (NADPH/NADH) small chain
LARALRELGVPVLNVSIGNPYFNPHLGRPYDFPVQGLSAPQEHPLEGIARFVGITRALQQAVPDIPVAGSGYTWLRHFVPNLAAALVRTRAATLIGQGRGAFAYPDSVRDLLEKGRMDPAKTCVACSGCTQLMRDGVRTGCVIRDSAVYGPEYRLGRRFAPDRLRQEALRCRQCLEASCVKGCPALIDIPAFLKAFAENDIRTSYEILRRFNALPEMCGYVCPACEQCEGACVEQIFTTNPIPIKDIQLVVSRLARRQGLAAIRLPDSPTGKRAAVVGGGPAGLACAIRLLEKGHHVTVFEKEAHLGGVPDAMIPGERYPPAAEEIGAILAPAQRAGRLEVRFNRTLGGDLTLEDLRKEYDAVFLAIGLGEGQSLGQAAGVEPALKFLREAKSRRRTGVPERVAVLGGGNTALDAALTARRLGARDVYLVYRRSFTEMPAWREERDAFLAAGGHVLILTQPLGYVSDERGRLTGVRIARTELGAPDQSGRRKPVVIPDSESVLPVGLAVEALGSSVSEELRAALRPLEFTREGFLAVRPDSCFTGTPKVYAGGDLVNGGTTVVQGIADGQRAAAEIDAALSEEREKVQGKRYKGKG